MKKLLQFRRASGSFFRLFLCVGLLIGATSVSAQSISNKKVTLDFKDAPIINVLLEIQKQTEASFAYEKLQIEQLKPVTIHVKDRTLEETLKTLLEGTGYTYKIADNVIAIIKAQEKERISDFMEVSGRVVDEKGHPLPGVAIVIKGTTVGVSTDHEGKYSITLPDVQNVRLVFTFIGMRPYEVAYAGQKEINVTLHEEATQIEEVVVTGYQVVDRRKSTSAVTSKSMDELMIQGATSLDQMLQGQIPDMMVITNSGEVGVVPKLRIRGTSTLIGNREPLWVVDGIILQDPVKIAPEELNDPDYINRIGNAISGLNPQDIDRIDVLKDAAATALYGTKAANGVIVITTKRGHIGKPIISYNTTLTLRQRPRYTDRSVDVMNSKERIGFSRDLAAIHYDYPTDMSMVGYEGLQEQLYNGTLSQEEFDKEVAKLETMNTDWFKLLTKDSFSHQHTLSISGGSEEMRYYASLGYMRANDVIWDDKNDRYTASVNLDANLAKWLTVSLSMNGNVGKRNYYQEELAPMDYAYRTSRAIPAYDEDGQYHYYLKKSATGYSQFKYNILNELENSSYEQETSTLTVNANLLFNFTDWLNANAILSYNTSHTTIEGWWGEKSYHAAELRGTEYGVLPEPSDEWGGDTGGTSLMPYGGELSLSESNQKSYTVRLQVNANKSLGIEREHNIFGSVGFELNSNRNESYTHANRGYYKDRGMSFVNDISSEDFPYYADWMLSNVPVVTDSKNNSLSAYASVSYSYRNYFTANVNGRIDGSNSFGDQSNDKLLPIWSVSGNWNVSEHDWMTVSWIDFLRLKASFGYQGNMLEDQTPVMIIRKEPMDTHYSENISTIERYPNPNLKWETTTSYNLGLEFSLFHNKLQAETSVYWKHTKDAFMNKTIASVNGVENNTYVVNGGDVDNNGYSISLTVSPINNENFRWTLSTSWSETFNKLESDPAADMYELENFLDGTALVKGEAVNTFYSYKFLGLSPVDGGPMFDDGFEKRYALQGLSKYDTYTRVLEPSGLRDPKISGSLNTTLRWKNIHLSGAFAYSLGNKIRLFSLYRGENTTRNAEAIYAEYNVSKDFLNRWQKPGDERYTDIPAIITVANDAYTKYERHWSDLASLQVEPIANTYWDMYDYGNHRVVSGNYLKCSNLSVTYDFGAEILDKLKLTRLSLTLSGANLFTISAKELKGQTPTQSGFATIQLGERPNYSFTLNVSF